MRRFWLVLAFLSGFAALYAEKLEDFILPCQYLIYAPSGQRLVEDSKNMLSRFYGRNDTQMKTQISTDSKSRFGFDLLDVKSLTSAGIDTSRSLCFVHLTNGVGYLLFYSTRSAETVASFQKRFPAAEVRSRGDVVMMSSTIGLLDQIVDILPIATTGPFQTVQKKLNFKWDKFFVWMENRVISEFSHATGVSENLSLPYAYTAMTVELEQHTAKVLAYTGSTSAELSLSLQRMGVSVRPDKIQLLDYIWGNPAVIGQVNLDMPAFYTFLRQIDTVDMLGLKRLMGDFQNQYKINLERDLINNSDGRVRFVIDRYQPAQNEVVIFGTVGVKNVAVAQTLMESLKQVSLASGAKLYSFDLFTKNFYHYRTTNSSFYYGLIENELYFSTDKDVLVQLVKNIFENRGGYLEKLPPALRARIEKPSTGIFLEGDTQSLFSQMEGGFGLNKDWLVGVKGIHLSSVPDLGRDASGWTTEIVLDFYH